MDSDMSEPEENFPEAEPVASGSRNHSTFSLPPPELQDTSFKDDDLRILVEENAFLALSGESLAKRPRHSFSAERSMEENEFFSLTFPRKLWKIVESDQFTSIHWNESGTCILIDEENFKEEILQKKGPCRIFETDSIKSFVRQLNLYGFSKIRQDWGRAEALGAFLEQEQLSLQLGQLQMYYNPNFKRGYPHLVSRLKRRVGVKNTDNRACLSTQNVNKNVSKGSHCKPEHQNSPEPGKFAKNYSAPFATSTSLISAGDVEAHASVSASTIASSSSSSSSSLSGSSSFSDSSFTFYSDYLSTSRPSSLPPSLSASPPASLPTSPPPLRSPLPASLPTSPASLRSPLSASLAAFTASLSAFLAASPPAPLSAFFAASPPAPPPAPLSASPPACFSPSFSGSPSASIISSPPASISSTLSGSPSGSFSPSSLVSFPVSPPASLPASLSASASSLFPSTSTERRSESGESKYSMQNQSSSRTVSPSGFCVPPILPAGASHVNPNQSVPFQLPHLRGQPPVNLSNIGGFATVPPLHLLTGSIPPTMYPAVYSQLRSLQTQLTNILPYCGSIVLPVLAAVSALAASMSSEELQSSSFPHCPSCTCNCSNSDQSFKSDSSGK